MRVFKQGQALCLLVALAATHGFQTGGPPRRQLSSSPRKLARRVTTLPQTSSPLPKQLAPEDQWVDDLKLDDFGREVFALGRRLESEQGPADAAHLNKIRRWSAMCGAVGVATMALPGPALLGGVNPIAVAALSLWSFSRWTMIAHHTCHGGYNRVSVPPEWGLFDGDRFKASTFGVGGAQARARDWLDWMLPEAWNVEHNVMHHYRLGESRDPDLVERNLEFVRQWRGPRALKYAFVYGMAGIWKWAYYAPNTFKQLKLHEAKQAGKTLPEGHDPEAAVTLLGALLKPQTRGGLFSPAEFLARVFLPVVALRFVALPAPLLLVPGVGPELFGRAVFHLFLADILTNLHGFLTIVTNHAGEDLYRFETPCSPGSPTFALRQVISSANYRTGGDLNDFMHGWLNYQVEHHVWPSLSMLSYQKGQPELKAICEKYGVPYVQESVWVRLKKTVDIMVGKTSMRRYPLSAQVS